jgi:DNA-binding CsgD family transcriptional regulator
VADGNPLFARELIRAAVEQGLMTSQGQLLRLSAMPRLPVPVTDLLWRELADLPTPVLDLLELVGQVEPVEIDLLAGVTGQELIEHAQRLDLVRVLTSGRRASLRLTHPLHGELLRQHRRGLTVSQWWRALSRALADTGLRRTGDALRLGRWHLNGVATADASVILRAIGEAAARFDHALVIDLGRAAQDIDAGFPARLAVAEGHAWAGELERAEQLLSELQSQAVEPAEHALAARDRASNLFFGLGRTSAAHEVIETALKKLDDPAWSGELVLLRAGMASCLTRGREAAELGALEQRGGDGDRLWLHSLPARINVLAVLGRTEEALDCARTSTAALQQAAGDFPYLLTTANIAAVEAALLHGEVISAAQIAEAGYRQAAQTRAEGVLGQWALAYGRALLARGQLLRAAERFRQGADLLGTSFSLLGRSGIRECLGGLAIATALAGDANTAAEAVRAADAITVEGCAAPWLSLARAWLPAAHGDLAAAEREALAAARLHAGFGNLAYEACALHLAAMFGGAPAVTDRLDELATGYPAPLRWAYAGHAAGLAAGDPKRLDQTAADFAALGGPLLAAVAASDAALCHADNGDTASAVISGERAHRYAEQSSGYVVLSRPGHPVVPSLTNREREVAYLAVAGLANAQIAAQMVLSVRTIESHLSHIYTKLDCSSRSELATLLALPGETTGG